MENLQSSYEIDQTGEDIFQSPEQGEMTYIYEFPKLWHFENMFKFESDQLKTFLYE